MDYGVILDLETTGLDSQKDQIIEIGIMRFAVEAGKLPVVVGTHSEIQDPGRPLTDEIIKITGLNDQLLAGHKIDWSVVHRMLEGASVVIAHNAEFDRAFIERQPELAGLSLHWACSARHINWRKHGFRTRALNYLAADHGFVNPFAHRALFDCATTFRLVAPYMKELIERSFMREYVVSAVGSAFETKDLLRNAGYRWDADVRVWSKRVFEDELPEERVFLENEIYKGPTRHREDEVRW